MSETPRRSCRRLSNPQFYALAQWLGTQAEQVLSERPTKAALARQAEAALAFPVSEDSIDAAAECAGLAWEPRLLVGGAARACARTRIDALARELADLRTCHDKQAAALQGLRGLVSHLYAQLNLDPLNGHGGKLAGLRADLLVDPKGGAS